MMLDRLHSAGGDSDREDVLFYWPISHRDWIGGFGVLSSFYEHSPVGNGTPHEQTDRVHREKC